MKQRNLFFSLVSVVLAAMALMTCVDPFNNTTKVESPVFSPAPGTFTSLPQVITITSPTAGSTVYSTTDGTTPVSTGQQGSNSIQVTISQEGTTTIKALGVKLGLYDSEITSGDYVITIPKVESPVFSPAPGTFTSLPQVITITSPTAGSTVYATTDGSTPVSDGQQGSDSIQVTISQEGTTTIKALGVKPGLYNSEIASADYVITLPPLLKVATPTISPEGYSFNTAQTLTFSCSEPGASIYYYCGTSSTPDSYTLYTQPINLPLRNLVQYYISAYATKEGMTNSDTVSKWIAMSYHWSPFDLSTNGVPYTLRDMVSYHGEFLAAGNGGKKAAQSNLSWPDPAAWVVSDNSSTNDIFAVLPYRMGITVYCNQAGYNAAVMWQDGYVCTVGNNGNILYGHFQDVPAAQTSGTSQDLNAICSGNSLLVAVGDAGTIATSGSGTSWNIKTIGTSDLRGVSWNGSLFVAVGMDGTILSSPDGDTWTTQTSGTTMDLLDVRYIPRTNNNRFWAVGEKGTILWSADAITWTSDDTGFGEDIHAVRDGGLQHIVAFASGKMLVNFFM